MIADVWHRFVGIDVNDRVRDAILAYHGWRCTMCNASGGRLDVACTFDARRGVEGSWFRYEDTAAICESCDSRYLVREGGWWPT